MKLSDLSTEFIQNMVQSMYKFESTQVKTIDLLTENEMMDFYKAYMGLDKND